MERSSRADKIDEGIDRANNYKYALEKLSQYPPINPSSFTNYSKKMVESDLAYVNEMEAKFVKEREMNNETRENVEWATIFEAVLRDQIDMNDWFGGEAQIITPSRYDDIKNGVDAIVEFTGDDRSASHLALAIDVTFSHNLADKINRIKSDIENGHLTQIKYFFSESMNIKGQLDDVPHIVVGADKNMIMELGGLWRSKKQKELACHKAQFQILEETRIQLQAFGEYANKKNQSKIANEYAKSLAIINKIIEGKHGTFSQKDFKEDRVFSAILENIL